MNLDTLAEAYLRNREEDFWAWEEVDRAVNADINEGWKIVLFLLERAVSDGDVEYVAAGPLEELIDRYGHKALDLVEEECKSNVRLRAALSTVYVIFYYEEFDRWYGLLYQYGLRTDRVADGAVISSVLGIMKAYLNDGIDVCNYVDSLVQALDKPFDDKSAQRILQKVRLDVEDSECITTLELKARVRQAVAELETLGY